MRNFTEKYRSGSLWKEGIILVVREGPPTLGGTRNNDSCKYRVTSLILSTLAVPREVYTE